MRTFFLTSLAVVAALLVLPSDAQSQSRFFPSGTDATLECTWDEVENPEDIKLVKWTYKGKRLREGKRYEYSREGKSHRLLIKNVQKKDKGTYFCSPKVSTDQELADGQFVVSVGKAKLPNAPDPREINLSEGGTGSLNCNYAEAKERYGLKQYWTYNGEKIRDSESATAVHEGSETQYRTYSDDQGRDWLALSNVDVDGAGTYMCNYKYPDKQIFSMQFDVNVAELRGPADVVRNVTVNEDRYTQSLSCDLSGLADAGISSYRWEKDGEVVSNETDPGRITLLEDGMQKTLEIDDLNSEDHSGVYRCIAELPYYPVALRFNVVVEPSQKERDFAPWSQWSSCDRQGKKYRFRTCVADGCSDYYGFVYEVETAMCNEGM